MNGEDPSSAAFFDAMYRLDPDPWKFATEAYEQRRYRRTLDYVPHGRYGDAFEPGCSVGVLTQLLAARCAHVRATDISPEAVALARQRCAALANVTIDVGGIGDGLDGFDGDVDLIVLSEVGYYLPEHELRREATRLSTRLRQGGRLIGVHWLGHSHHHRIDGRSVHRVLGQVVADWTQLEHVVVIDDDHDGFILDVWDRS